MTEYCKCCGQNTKSVWQELQELNEELDKENEKYLQWRVIVKKD